MKAYEKYISTQTIQNIHENTLRILSEVGVKFESEPALEVFRKNGAKVDGDVVFIPESLVEQALKSVPSSFEIYDDADTVVKYGGGAQEASGVGGNIYICEDGHIRKTTNEDVIRQFKLALASGLVTLASVDEFPDKTGFTHEQRIWASFAMRLKYSTKRLINLNLGVRGLSLAEAAKCNRAALDLLKRFKGIEGADKHYDLMSLNALSPLAFDALPLDKIFCACERNQPLLISTCAMPLLTAPASVAGLMSTTNAEVLAGLTLAQLMRPGLPFMYGNTSGSTDMRTIQLCIGAPETALITYATAGLADFYHLPFRAGGALSDAKDFDAQAGLESLLMQFATYDVKPDYIMHGAGCMGTFNVVSFEKYILDEEAAGIAKRMLQGVSATDETLAFDEVKKAGARGTFLHGRTPQMFRQEFYMPKLLNRDDPNNWQNAGAHSIREKAREEAERRIAAYTPPQRTKEQLALIEAYIPEAYRQEI